MRNSAMVLRLVVLCAPLCCIHASAQLPLGTVSGVVSETCPANLGGQPADWVTLTSGGTDVVALCYRATVSCPNVPDDGVTYGIATPTASSKGTIVFVSSQFGTFTLPGNYKNQAPYDLFHAGYQTVQFAWDSSWQAGSTNGSIKTAACRVATFLNFINTQYYEPNSTKSATAGMCAHSQSGGAGGLAMSLTYYGVSSFLDKVVFVSGPHYADLVQGCWVPNAPPVEICPTPDGVTYPMGCNTLSGSWTDSPVYTGGAAGGISTEMLNNPPCNNPKHTYTTADQINLTSTSLVDGAADASYSYPQTAITAWECDDDSYWSNPSEAQGWIYLSQLKDPIQVGSGCTNSRNPAYPNACLSVNRVYGCSSPELAASGYVCSGSTCPVCTGNPPTSCTCGGVPCSTVKSTYAMPNFREADWEDPINGCIKRHTQ